MSESNPFQFPESEDLGQSTVRGIKTDGELGVALPSANKNVTQKFEREVHGEDAKHAQFKEGCTKCSGSGRFTSWSGRDLGQCFSCKGNGFKLFATSTEDRAKARQSRKDRHQAKVDEFLAEHADIAAWFESSTNFEFAQSLRAQVEKKASLSDKQIAAARKCIAKVKDLRAKDEVRKASAQAVDVSTIVASFKQARESGLKKPKLRFEGFAINRAPDTGKNPGALYVTDGSGFGGTYYGKIIDGAFQTSRDCTGEIEKHIVETLADPAAAAVAYGKRTGSCSCCGRELTNQVSIDRGIGPICAEKYGW